MTAALLVSESEVLIFQGCRLQPSFRNAEQVGAAQQCCHLVSCQFPTPHWVPPCTSGRGRKNAYSCSKFQMCNAHSRKWDWQTGVVECTWSLWDFMWCSCVTRKPENGILEGELLLLLLLASRSSSRCVSVDSPSPPSSAVLFTWLVSDCELWTCPGPGSMGARLPGCCDSTIMSMCCCGKWHQFCSFCHSMSGAKLHKDCSRIETFRNI